MGTATMARVVVKATIENLEDLWLVRRKELKKSQVHCLKDVDARVDTGSTYLAMPKSRLRELGFTKPYGTSMSRTATGEVRLKLYGTVQLTVQGRFCRIDVAEIAEGNPIVIGQVPLEIMDFIVDPKREKLVGNLEHGGQWMIDQL